MNDDANMKQLLVLMCLIDWLANDLHYKSRGPGFYEKHLLADRVRDIGDDDELKEAYWLGFKGVEPPLDAEIAGMAISVYTKMTDKTDLLKPLEYAFGLAVEVIEQCKTEPGLPSGVQSILDNISQKALTYKFLIQSESAR